MRTVIRTQRHARCYYPRFPAMVRIHDEVRARLRRQFSLPEQAFDRSYHLFCAGVDAGSRGARRVSLLPPDARMASFRSPELDAQYARAMYNTGIMLGREAVKPITPRRIASNRTGF